MNTANTGALIKRLGEVIVERDKLKKQLEQERFNHLNTRIAWDATLQKLDKLKQDMLTAEHKYSNRND